MLSLRREPDAPELIVFFADFELDEDAFELRRGGAPQVVQPKVLDVLFFLVRRRDRVVGRDEILSEVWGGVTVGDASLARAVREVRRVLGDDGEGQRFVKTVHGRGYRFVAPVTTVGERPVAAQAPPLDPEVVPDDFVGRASCVDRFVALLEAARRGAGGILLLPGEPGIGKTRLLEHLAQLARAGGARTLFGRAHEEEGSPPFWPWTQVLRDHFDGEGEALDSPPALRALLAEVSAIVPDLVHRVPDLGSPAPLDTPAARFRLFDAVARLLAHAARDAPIVIVLDDLHWADSSSLLLLQFLATEARRARLLLLAAYRDHALARAPALEHAIGAAIRSGAVSAPLDGFSGDEIARYVQIKTGRLPDAPEIEMLAARTAGNPLFLTQILDLAGDWTDERRLPAGMLEAIGRHVDMLSDDCRRLLSVASALGHSWSLSLVSAASGDSPDALAVVLDEAIRSRVLRRTALGWEFVHPLVRDALYERLSVPERTRLHAAAGDALLRLSGDDASERAAELARHYLRAAATRRDAALRFAPLAAEQAFEKAAFDEAARLLHSALEMLDLGPDDPASRRGLLLRLGSALGRDDRLPEAAQAFRAAAAVPREAPDGEPAPIPPIDADALRESFYEIVDRRAPVSVRFYEVLFSRFPETRSLFGRNGPEKQQKMFADALTAIVDHAHDAPWLRRNLLALGARHAGYGVTDEMYPWVGTSLLAALADLAGDAWTPRVEKAWRDAYIAISATMIEGGRRAERESRPSA